MIFVNIAAAALPTLAVIAARVEEYGPFATLLAAAQDTQRNGESALEPGETVEEAESEICIADWIDPDTGAPAEEDGTRTELH